MASIFLIYLNSFGNTGHVWHNSCSPSCILWLETGMYGTGFPIITFWWIF